MINFNGMPIIVDRFLRPEVVGYRVPDVAFRHGRNHREWRRLVRERRKHARPIEIDPVYQMGGRLVMSPRTYEALKR